MKLYKDNLVKEISKEKTANRLMREGWKANLDEAVAPVAEEVPQEPKRRGRPAKVETNGDN